MTHWLRYCSWTVISCFQWVSICETATATSLLDGPRFTKARKFEKKGNKLTCCVQMRNHPNHQICFNKSFFTTNQWNSLKSYSLTSSYNLENCFSFIDSSPPKPTSLRPCVENRAKPLQSLWKSSDVQNCRWMARNGKPEKKKTKRPLDWEQRPFINLRVLVGIVFFLLTTPVSSKLNVYIWEGVGV